MSADARAMGLTTMSAATGASVTNSESNEHSAKLGVASVTSASSSDSGATSTVSTDHSHKHHGYGDSSHMPESRHSGTGLSGNTSGDTNGSFSHGTSQKTG